MSSFKLSKSLKKRTKLREELGLFRRKFFGRSSERHVEDDSQLHLFGLGEETTEEVEGLWHLRRAT